MKKHFYRVFAVVLALVIAVSLVPARKVAAKVTPETLLVGTKTQRSNSHLPFDGDYADNNIIRSQFIYPSTKISSMKDDRIISMEFYIKDVAEEAWGVTFEIRLMEVSVTTIESEFIDTANATVVYTGQLSGLSTNMKINFDKPYTYKGGNLLVEFRTLNRGSKSYVSFYSESTTAKGYYGYHNNLLPSTGSTETELPICTFEYFDGYIINVINSCDKYITVDVPKYTIEDEEVEVKVEFEDLTTIFPNLADIELDYDVVVCKDGDPKTVIELTDGKFMMPDYDVQITVSPKQVFVPSEMSFALIQFTGNAASFGAKEYSKYAMMIPADVLKLFCYDTVFGVYITTLTETEYNVSIYNCDTLEECVTPLATLVVDGDGDAENIIEAYFDQPVEIDNSKCLWFMIETDGNVQTSYHFVDENTGILHYYVEGEEQWKTDSNNALALYGLYNSSNTEGKVSAIINKSPEANVDTVHGYADILKENKQGNKEKFVPQQSVTGTTIYIEPHDIDGYKLDKILVNGEKLTINNGVYSFQMPAKNVTVDAQFVLDPVRITERTTGAVLTNITKTELVSYLQSIYTSTPSKDFLYIYAKNNTQYDCVGYNDGDGWIYPTVTIAKSLEDTYGETYIIGELIEAPIASEFTFTAPEELEYDGEAKEATVTTEIETSRTITVNYFDSNGDKLKAAPTEAGTYTVKIDVTAGKYLSAIEDLTDTTWTFEIEESDDLTIENPDVISWTYDGKDNSGECTANIEEAEIYYSLDNENWSKELPTIIDAGTYTVYAKAELTNYITATTSWEYEVSKKDLTITSGSARTIFNGKVLTCDKYNVEGLVGEDQIDVKCAGKILYYGKTLNTVEYAFSPETNADNYNVVVVEGELYVAQDEILILIDMFGDWAKQTERQIHNHIQKELGEFAIVGVAFEAEDGTYVPFDGEDVSIINFFPGDTPFGLTTSVQLEFEDGSTRILTLRLQLVY